MHSHWPTHFTSFPFSHHVRCHHCLSESSQRPSGLFVIGTIIPSLSSQSWSHLIVLHDLYCAQDPYVGLTMLSVSLLTLPGCGCANAPFTLTSACLVFALASSAPAAISRSPSLAPIAFNSKSIRRRLDEQRHTRSSLRHLYDLAFCLSSQKRYAFWVGIGVKG